MQAGSIAGLAITLEPFGERHLAGVEGMLADPELLRFTRVPEPAPPGFARTWLERYEEARREGGREAFAIVDESGAFLGLALAPSRGRGVASEALRRLTAWAFAELGMLRLELLISAENTASKRVAERCGYVREGVLRSRHVKQDLREDTEIWSRLATDP
jgi:RimJ/RimL family protein N-acetyltransferase